MQTHNPIALKFFLERREISLNGTPIHRTLLCAKMVFKMVLPKPTTTEPQNRTNWLKKLEKEKIGA